MKVYAGSYTGNAADDRAITGVTDGSLTPETVIISPLSGQSSVFKTASMDALGEESGHLRENSGWQLNHIQTLDVDGFTIGSDANVNQTGVEFAWIAFVDDGDGDFVEGIYTGNGADDRDITAPGVELAVLAIKADSGATGAWRVLSQAVNNSMPFHEFGGERGNEIQDFITNGFELGSGGEVNASGVDYAWFGVAVGDGVAEGFYTGDANDDRTIGAPDFEPVAGFLRADASPSNNRPVIGSDVTRVDDSYDYTFTSPYPGANHIQDMVATGFEIGTDNTVNASGVDYFYAMFQVSVPPVVLAVSGVVKLGGVVVEGATVRIIDSVLDTYIDDVLSDVDGLFAFSGVTDSLFHVIVEFEDTAGDFGPADTKYNARSLWAIEPVAE